MWCDHIYIYMSGSRLDLKSHVGAYFSNESESDYEVIQ